MKKETLEYGIEFIPCKHLSVIWRKSQRPYNEAWAKKIAEDFDPDKYEPISVTKPNGAGIYHIVEGQHRKGAVEMLWGPETQIACRVIAEADPSRAAEIWLGINKGRKQIRPIVEFMVAVEAAREMEVAINKIVRRAEYHITENTKSDNAIGAVGALRKVYTNYGELTLRKTLDTCRYLWGTDPGGVSGYILTGMSMFLNEFGSYIELSHLRKVIQGQYTSPRKFIDAARVESEKSSETMDVAMSELLRMKYNKGQRDHKKLKRKLTN